MAFTVYQQPALFSPAYNDHIFVVSSTNKTQVNFNYIAQVYVGSDVITLKAPPNPTYGSGVFNIGRIIENYVTSDIGDGTAGFQINSNSYKSYYVKFGEEYGSTVTQYLNLNTTPTKYVWNGVLDYVRFQNYSFNDYSADGGKLLNKSITRCINLDEDAWLYFVANDTTMFQEAYIYSFNANGNGLREVRIQNTFTSSGTIGNHFMRFSAGPNNINLIPSGVIVNDLGSGAIIPSNTAWYTIKFEGGSVTDTYRFNIGCGCSKYDTFRLHFLNELGAFESFNFTGMAKTTSAIEKASYKAPVGALTSATAFGYSLKDRGDKHYFVNSKDTLRLKSGWLNDAESLWLRELVESPEIYLDDATYGLIAVNCKTTNYEVKTALKDKVFQLEIEIEYSYNRFRQRY